MTSLNIVFTKCKIKMLLDMLISFDFPMSSKCLICQHIYISYNTDQGCFYTLLCSWGCRPSDVLSNPEVGHRILIINW